MPAFDFSHVLMLRKEPSEAVTTKKTTMPADLGAAGKKLWRAVSTALLEGWSWDERELAILEMAAHQADELAAFEQAVREYGTIVLGSKGQPRLNPAALASRQARLTTSHLLGQLGLPDESEQPKTAAQQHGAKAARARWSS
jgi:phage terminase small subunit